MAKQPLDINSTVLMSGVDYFDDTAAINPFMDSSLAVNRELAGAEHSEIQRALESAGVKVVKVTPPVDCQDGVYTANWALVRGNKAVMSLLPNARSNEEAYAEQVLRDLGKEIVHVPDGLRFSGQGDALPCGNLLFCGQGYRSDEAAQAFAAETLGYERVQLLTVPKTNWRGKAVINKASGWPDSFFYDIDLALSVLRAPRDGERGLIAWCPEAFTPESQQILRSLNTVEKIEVSLEEAKIAFACNLVSTGSVVIMSAKAPRLQAELKKRGFSISTPEIDELLKGGGYIRCTTLTLDND
ncbi:MAG TPA: amidinotransferase [Candidatus Saccharibacteria bacterium]|nr:amidinotransferase [Candidatus Saccharibacteria bacterium]